MEDTFLICHLYWTHITWHTHAIIQVNTHAIIQVNTHAIIQVNFAASHSLIYHSLTQLCIYDDSFTFCMEVRCAGFHYSRQSFMLNNCNGSLGSEHENNLFVITEALWSHTKNALIPSLRGYKAILTLNRSVSLVTTMKNQTPLVTRGSFTTEFLQI